TPSEEDIHMDLMNASKQPVTKANDASLFDSSDSFVIIRVGHIELVIMGALQIDQFGEIANWAISGKYILDVCCAIVLLFGANRIIIASMYQAKDETPKLVDKLSFPSSGYGKADMLVTEHGVFKFTENGTELIEQLSDISVQELQEITGAKFSYKNEALYQK